jgi:hypothetical protein
MQDRLVVPEEGLSPDMCQAPVANRSHQEGALMSSLLQVIIIRKAGLLSSGLARWRRAWARRASASDRLRLSPGGCGLALLGWR